ncbi:MAG: sugar phosphate isomerase/epimerase [Chloroflexi bacterium]|nr:sugar phosphate isomerase/epimerase [Chloroflexota bacterium]MDA1281997.1 sugar phosphate isomerase/epimerase [Chloroflexota bacterium]
MIVTLGYSTYALRMVDPFEAVRMIKDVGYDALEICAADGWPSSPIDFSTNQQRDLAKLSQDLGFRSPIMFGLIDVCAPQSDRISMLELTKKKFEMAQQLHYDDSPILITTTPGHSAPPWESGKDQIRDAFLTLADMAAENDITIAIEAHAGTDFETPEKAVWMMEQSQHTNLKLDLDISHFVVEGAELVHSVDLTAEHSVMVHIKDGEKIDGQVQFCLPGDGGIDIPRFMTALRSNGLEHMPVFAEVSVQQSRQADYSPRRAAEFCYNALDTARKTIS